MAEISQITLPSGTTYDIKDATARAAASGGIQLKGTTTTALVDEATTNPITINGNSYTAVNQDAVFYGKKEFVFDGTKWHEFGDMSGLGSLATKDSATGNFTPSGSVTISTGSGTANYTPAGSVTVKAQKSGGTASSNYTPEGTVSVTPSTTTVNSITAVGTLPSLTMTVSNENLTIGWSQGTLPTKSSDQTVATGISSASFSGTQVSLSGSFSGTGAELKGSFSGTQGSVTVS